jgi:predicted ArsR family transcriptional regulator
VSAVVGRRGDVLAVLRQSATPRTIGEIAERLSVHPNTVRFHLQSLVKAGQVECVEVGHAKPGRPPLIYRVVAGMDPAGPRHYRMLAAILADAIAREPGPPASAIAAGRAWSRQLAGAPAPVDTQQAVERLTKLLEELGFAPENGCGTDYLGDIGLRSCPFLELARSNADVVCSIHLGLMQGALSAWEAPITVDALTPFAEADLCLAHLTAVGPIR